MNSEQIGDRVRGLGLLSGLAGSVCSGEDIAVLLRTFAPRTTWDFADALCAAP
jgi:hypothetical protein